MTKSSLKPAVPGHTILFTKKHYPIIEEVPNKTAAHLLVIANKLSTAIFESVACHGTNIIIENGTAAGQMIPHVSVHIIPRNEDDKLNLEWQPKKLSSDDIDIVHAQLLAKTELITLEPEHNEEAHETHDTKHGAHDSNSKDVHKEVHNDKKKSYSDNYKYKQLRRIP